MIAFRRLKNALAWQLAFVLGLGVIGLLWLNHNRLVMQNTHLQKQYELLEVAFGLSVDKYHILVEELLVRQLFSQEVLELYAKGVQAHGKTQAYARGALYKELYPLYAASASIGLRQLHFHLPDGRSFLRFHRPERHGDLLFEARPSVFKANITRQVVTGFEAGKVVSGYRFVYPLFLQGEFLGTVEASTSMGTIVETLGGIDTAREYGFIINGSIVTNLLFESQKRLYTPTQVHPNFVVEDIGGELGDSVPPFSPRAAHINALLAKNPTFVNALDKGLPYKGFVTVANEGYAVLAMPTQSISRGPEGYLLSYVKDQTAHNLWKDFFIVLGLSSLWGGLVVGLLVRNHFRNKTLAQEKEKMQTILHSLKEGVYVTDQEGHILEANAAAVAMLGYTKAEMLGKVAHDLFHKHEKNGHISLAQCPTHAALLERGVYESEEEFFQTKAQEILQVRVYAQSIPHESHQEQFLVTFESNGEKRKQEYYQRILTKSLEASINGVVITDTDAIIQWANPAFEALTGYSVGEALGKTPKEIIGSGKQNPLFYEILWQTILGGKTWSGEVINRKKDGSFYSEALSITPIKDTFGKTTHFVAIKQDITQAKEAQEALKKAKQEAESAVRAKSEFLANISHEIRTPLGAIVGLGELLGATPLSPRQADLLEKIKYASEVLLQGVGDIADYSKLERGSIAFVFKEVSPRKILEAQCEWFSRLAMQKGLDFTVEGMESLPLCVITDSARLTQIFSNLLTNAIKFTHEGGVVVEVQCPKQTSTHAHLCIKVQDSGIGMRKKQVESLFSPVVQGDSSVARRYGGTGLGLGIVKKLLDALGGTLHVSSVLGEGSCFAVELPVEICTKQEEHREKSLEELPDLSEKVILVVEDNLINQEVAGALLEHVNATVVFANNGKEGVDIFAQNPKRFSAVLMDIQMPVMDGYEATRHMRRYAKEIPIIALSAAASEEDRQKAARASMNDFLAKPIETKELYGCLARWCGVSEHITPQPDTKENDARPLVLIVDHRPENIVLLSGFLKEEYHVKVATNSETALRVARDSVAPHLILLDTALPSMSGYEVCQALKNDSKTKEIPVIFTTAKSSPKEEAYGFSLGAVDYITKPYNELVVSARVRYHVLNRLQNASLEKLSLYDGLTQIFNRRYFDEYFHMAFLESEREATTLAVMMLDIDYFKPFNDHYGHGHGDYCLRLVAGALKENLKRPSDIVARYGGEEFVVVVKGLGDEQVLALAGKLNQAVRNLGVVHEYSSVARVVTISIGVAIKHVDEKLQKSALLKRADEALYEAKSKGRDRVIAFTCKGIV